MSSSWFLFMSKQCKFLPCQYWQHCNLQDARMLQILCWCGLWGQSPSDQRICSRHGDLPPLPHQPHNQHWDWDLLCSSHSQHGSHLLPDYSILFHYLSDPEPRQQKLIECYTSLTNLNLQTCILSSLEQTANLVSSLDRSSDVTLPPTKNSFIGSVLLLLLSHNRTW